MTGSQKIFKEILDKAIDDPNTTKITAVESDRNVLIGDVSSGKIDVDDINKFGDEGAYLTKARALGHEIKEQYEIQAKGRCVNEAHALATNAENRINRTVRSPISTQDEKGNPVIKVTNLSTKEQRNVTLVQENNNLKRLDNND